MGGHWWEYMVGGAWHFNDRFSVYGTVEKTTGGAVETPFEWNVGVRYLF
ncbi:MAG: autotransporter outer membrane beta-barrel domain-containing protein [Sutterellaceae bacterium]|nr:autotransporter outer membrane beta-barrel domain-containing protein [Sutterellaceae bacterium]